MSSIDKSQGWIKLSPLFIPWTFILAGLFLTLLQSFNFFIPVLGGSRGDAYIKILMDIHIWQSIAFSFYVAFLTAFFSSIIGFSLALLFWDLSNPWQRIIPVYKILLVLPHISVAYIAILLFSRTGLLSSFLFRLGFIDDFRTFPVLVFDNKGIGIILAYLMKEIPFVILMISAHLHKIPSQLLQSAQMLGGGKIYIIRRIVIPSSMPSVISVFLILFLYSFGGFEIPFLLGGSKPVMISVTVYDMLFRKGFAYRAEAMVVLIIILLISIIILLLFFRLFKTLSFRKLFL